MQLNVINIQSTQTEAQCHSASTISAIGYSVAKTTNLLHHERHSSIRIAIIASKNNSSADGFRSGRCTGAKQLDERLIGFSFIGIVIEIEQIDSCEEGEVRSMTVEDVRIVTGFQMIDSLFLYRTSAPVVPVS